MKLSNHDKIIKLIRDPSIQGLSPEILALSGAVRELHGDSVKAVLFYGSCLRSGNLHDGLADLYLLVDDYRSAFKSRAPAFFNKLLPPNVFYLEVPFAGKVLRAKYAVLTLTDFRQGTKCWFHSYLWGRFAQKSGTVYVCDETVNREVGDALADAAVRFIAQALPSMEGAFTARDLWSKGLSLSYRSELRTEEPEQAAGRLFDADPAYYQALTGLILEAAFPTVTVTNAVEVPVYRVELANHARRLNGLRWGLRIIQGKILSVLRLLKGLCTFKGGIDYILWKIERHSGARVEISSTLRRVPPVAVIVIFWRLYRQNAFR